MLFKSKLAASFGTALLVLLWIGVLSYRRTVQAEADQQWVMHTHFVMEDLDAMQADLLDCETTQRGYILTGDEVYLALYEAAFRRVSDDLSALRSLTADNSRQQISPNRLSPLVSAKLEALGSGIDARKQDGMAAALAAVGDDSDQESMVQIRVLIDQMKQEDQRLLLQERTENVALTSQYAKQTIIFGYLSAILFLLGAGCIVFDEMDRRKRVEAEFRRSDAKSHLHKLA